MIKLGPMNPNFDINVSDYLDHNPQLPEYDCLKQFFSDLRRGQVPNRCRKAGGTFLVYACDHIITISDNDPGTVLDITKLGQIIKAGP